LALGGLAAGPVYERPSDPHFPLQWSLENVGQPVRKGSTERGIPDADIDAVEAFASGHTGQGVIVAVIGIGMRYEDFLAGALWRNPGETPSNGLDDDGNGLVDDIVGYDFGAGDPSPDSDSRHDLSVAEIALAPHDGKRGAGVAPGARLMVLRVADARDRVKLGPLGNALVYAVQNGARVILLPWTYRNVACQDPSLAPLNALMEQAARHALIVGGEPGSWPACLPAVVSVQATGADDRPLSGRSADIDFAAPGSNGITRVGTSFAIGLVGGAAAVLMAENPGWSPAAVRGQLARTADRVHPDLAPYVGGRNDLFGSGRINLARALGTDFDGDGLLDPDDPDADGDGIPDVSDLCPLVADPDCLSIRPGASRAGGPRKQPVSGRPAAQ
jgi:hypothetical protein